MEREQGSVENQIPELTLTCHMTLKKTHPLTEPPFVRAWNKEVELEDLNVFSSFSIL